MGDIRLGSVDDGDAPVLQNLTGKPQRSGISCGANNRFAHFHHPFATEYAGGNRDVLDFSLIGILSSISGILAENKIGIFAISTFNTDYILVKSENYQKAADALARAGYTVTD